MRLRYYALLCGNVQGNLQLQSSIKPFDITSDITKFSLWGSAYAFAKGSS